MANVLIPLAPGFEELEAITIIDLLRRAGIEVVTASLDDQPVTASRNTTVIADTRIDQVMFDQFDMIVLPGGLPGANHLRDNPQIQTLIKRQNDQGKLIGAICAAPKALAAAGILKGKQITCYPGSLDELEAPEFSITDTPVKQDGNIITSKGPGTAMDFALELIKLLAGTETMQKVSKQLARK